MIRPCSNYFLRQASLAVTLMLLSGTSTTGFSQAVAKDVLQGTLNGEFRTWTIMKRNHRSTATFVEIAPDIWRFTLQGNVGDDFTIKESLSISFTIIGDVIQPATVSYFPEAATEPLYSVAGSMALELDSLEVTDDSAHVTGRFSDDLAYMEQEDSDPDTSHAVKLDIEFDVIAIRESPVQE